MGDILIRDHHQFQSTNLLVVISLPNGFVGVDYPEGKFYICYADTQISGVIGASSCIRSSDLDSESSAFYHSVKLKV